MKTSLQKEVPTCIRSLFWMLAFNIQRWKVPFTLDNNRYPDQLRGQTGLEFNHRTGQKPPLLLLWWQPHSSKSIVTQCNAEHPDQASRGQHGNLNSDFLFTMDVVWILYFSAAALAPSLWGLPPDDWVYEVSLEIDLLPEKFLKPYISLAPYTLTISPSQDPEADWSFKSSFLWYGADCRLDYIGCHSSDPSYKLSQTVF